MTTKLIAENILNPDMFLSATEQDGEHIGQPEADSDNEGNLRLLAAGDIQDFNYPGTATDDGAAGKTTTIDSKLCVYGDDYFIGGTIEITSGGSDGESQTITDFAQATGTLTHAAFTNQITTGTTFTLTLVFSSREFQVELIDGGDVGDASFKWSHDGGDTWLGRDPIAVASWLGEASMATGLYDSDVRTPICQMANGDLLLLYTDDSGAPGKVQAIVSSDNGITWGSPVQVTSYGTGAARALDVICLKNGRVLAAVQDLGTLNQFYYSDDNGETWVFMGVSNLNQDSSHGSLLELPNGSIMYAYVDNGIKCATSTDGGGTWGSAVTVASAANTQNQPQLTLAENGNIVCVYISDEDGGAGEYEIKGAYSSDGGATWTDSVAVIDGNVHTMPDVIKDIDGTLYAIGVHEVDDKINLVYSTDNGESWNHASSIAIVTDATNGPRSSNLALVDGHTIICAYNGDVTNKAIQVRRGIWEVYSANECPCAIEGIKQYLCCDVRLLWHGSAGIAEDSWTFDPEYYFGMANIIEDSPSKPWRSETDNAACNIVIDTGANSRVLIDGIAFFGCNVRTLSFQMNATDVWGGPSIDESVSFDLVTGIVDSVAGRNIQDTSLLANYKDHALKGYYFRATSGTDDGVTWKILDNVGSWIVLDTESSHNIAATDTFAIFQPWIAYTFTNTTPYRYIRISIDAQHTAEDYYQIGMAVMGKAVTLSKSWGINYKKSHVYNLKALPTPAGSLNVIKGADRKRKLQLSWNVSENTYKQIIGMVDHLDGKNICIIPDSDTLTECFLMKALGEIIAENVTGDKYKFSFELTEV